MIDLDGRYEYSKILSVQRTARNLSVINTFPNPSNGTITINFESRSQRDAEFTITDISGKEVYTHSAIDTKEQTFLKLDLSHLSNGSYSLNLKDNFEVVSQKIMLSK